MSLADRAKNRPDTVHGKDCSVGELIERLQKKPNELAAFQEIMYGRPGLTEPARGYKGWYEQQVFDAVKAEGYKVAKNQINEHRGKRCRCYRDAA